MITISIAGDTPAAIGKQASELAALLAGKPTSTPTPAKQAPTVPAKAASKPAPTPAPAAETGEVTLNSLRDLGRACIKAGKNAEMKAALAELGADSLTTMDPAKYAEADVALRAVIDGTAAGSDGL